MQRIEFELIPFHVRPEPPAQGGRKARNAPWGPGRIGRHGTVGTFGEITVENPLGGRPDLNHLQRAFTSGWGFPVAELTGREENARPSLERARLTLDTHPVQLTRNRKGLTDSARALRMSFREREYTYRTLGLMKGGELRRDDVRITCTVGRHIPDVGLATAGVAEGPVDPTDIALAVLFEQVDIDLLGVVGTALNLPLRLLRSNGEPLA